MERGKQTNGGGVFCFFFKGEAEMEKEKRMENKQKEGGEEKLPLMRQKSGSVLISRQVAARSQRWLKLTHHLCQVANEYFLLEI